ncbi:MAG: hypothetical protein QF489_06210 [Planctomycetota bacterium]|jgi:hypothetical protein|nr:hypothetical protein [Planctomycetota bacterium]
MNPSEIPPLWSFAEIRKWLTGHPDALEPGLSLLDQSLDLGHGLEVPLVGIDPLGHPCLVLYCDEFGARLFDQLLEMVARMQAEGLRFQPLFPRPTEPRVFLLSPSFEQEVRQRLALLAKAFPLRAFTILPPLGQDTAPQLIHEHLDAELAPTQLADRLPQGLEPFANRLLSACEALRPRLRVQGTSWPLVFHGSHGPCATLFFENEELWFAAAGQQDQTVPWKLQADSGVDRAIDVLMRHQVNSVSSAA